MISIRSLNDGFRRAGQSFTREPKQYPNDFFTEAQLEALETEPMLEVKHLPDPAKPDPEEEARTRAILEGHTVARLKADCDAMGIEYPANAVKAVLIDLILKNTAPVPEE
jgi:hypothetical protein